MKQVLDKGARWRNLAKANEPSLCDGDAAFVSNYCDHWLFRVVVWRSCTSAQNCKSFSTSNCCGNRARRFQPIIQRHDVTVDATAQRKRVVVHKCIVHTCSFQANRLRLWDVIIHIHCRHLLFRVILGLKADTHFTVPQRVDRARLSKVHSPCSRL